MAPARARQALLPRGPREIPLDLLVAGVAVGSAVAVREVLDARLGDAVPYITLFPAIAVAAWARGLLAGLLATLGGTVAGLTILSAPAGEAMPASLFPLALFVLGAALISLLGGDLHAARRTALAARDRADLLADASAILGRSLDPVATVEALTRLAVPRFADWCVIDLVDDEGRFSDARVAHADPDRVELAYRLRREFPVDAGAASGPGHVVRTGRPEYTPDLPPGFLDTVPDRRYREILAGLGLRSYLCVPLAAPGRALGAISFAMAESRRHFSVDDLAVARELGQRAGVALDHARLFDRATVRGDELDRVITAMDDAALVADASGRITAHNPAAERILGPDMPATVDAVLEGLEPHGADGDAMLVPATRRFVRPVVRGVGADSSASRIVILRDVTDLLESQAARDAFLGMLSHELRTPITTIYGAATVLLRPLADDTRDNLVRDLAAETDRLYRLVEDLLVLSRYERGRLEINPEPVLVQRVLPRVAQVERERWPLLRIEVALPPGLPPAVADATYLEQVTRNLIGNAAKYGGPEGTIRVTAEAAGDWIAVRVEDEGPGIADDARERVFNLYERLPEAVSSAAPGAGIGLFVCRRLVRMMGGEIGVRRGSRGGALFEFTLPTYAVPDEEPELPTAEVV